MGIVLIILVVIVVWYYATHSKNQKIWRVLAKHPDAVIAMIEDSDDWVITKRAGKSFPRPDGSDWIGPFNLILSGEGRVEFWGRKNVSERQLEDLANLITTGKLPGAADLLRRAGIKE